MKDIHHSKKEIFSELWLLKVKKKKKPKMKMNEFFYFMKDVYVSEEKKILPEL